MSKRVLLSLLVIMLACSASFGATWKDNAEQWMSGAWNGTKNFFTASRRIDDLTRRVDDLTKKVDRLNKIVAGHDVDVRASEAECLSSDKESASRDVGLMSKEQALADRVKQAASLEHELKTRENTLSRNEQKLKDREKQAASLEHELKTRENTLSLNEQALADRVKDFETRSAARESDLSAREQAMSYNEAQFTARSKDLAELAAELHFRDQSYKEVQLRQQAIDSKAAKYYASLKNDPHISKFIEAGMLDRIDIDNMYYNKRDGAIDILGTPYGKLTVELDSSKYGFIDTNSLKDSLITLFRDDSFSLFGDFEVVLVRSDDKADWFEQINSVSSKAFFTLDGLTSELQSLSSHPVDNALSEIALFLSRNNKSGRLRLFFRTRHEGLYIMVLMNSEDSVSLVYLVADSSHKLIERRNIARELRLNTELRNSDKDVALFFDKSDNKIDGYIDRFVRNIVRKIPPYRR